MTGAKLSTVNVTTGRIRGVQVDAFNYAEEGEFQLCLITDGLGQQHRRVSLATTDLQEGRSRRDPPRPNQQGTMPELCSRRERDLPR